MGVIALHLLFLLFLLLTASEMSFVQYLNA